MDARPVLSLLARVLEQCDLEAILIGNAAAAVQGAPVTTLDVDFLFRKDHPNLAKLRSVARALGAMILRPYYPFADFYRLARDDDGLQVDFMAAIDGVGSFESLRSRAWRLDLDGSAILVADLADVVGSKRAAGRPRDRAVLEILERTLEEKNKADAATKTRRSPA